jgi:hypothetical protein
VKDTGVAIALPSINTAPDSITILAINLKIINNSKKLCQYNEKSAEGGMEQIPRTWW